MIPLSLILLAALACIGPIATYAHLWQIKEWRFDRLHDHLKSDGALRLLLGTKRPMLLVAFLVLGVPHVLHAPSLAPLSPAGITLVGLVTFSFLGLTSLAIKRSPRPVLTMKAVILMALTLTLTVLVATIIVREASLAGSVTLRDSSEHGRLLALLILPLVQPLFLLCAWILFTPIDRWRKAIIIERATMARKRHQNLRVVGITGSVGKTTTKELVARLLKEEGALATPLHVNTEIGVARWLESILAHEPLDSTRILVVEMGAYRKGEIATLCDIAQPTIGLVTYVGRQHVSLFGSEEAIADGKGELLASLPKKGVGFVNSDSPLLTRLIARSTVRPTTVGTDATAEIRALDVEETPRGLRFRALETTFDVPLAGTHTVSNIILAIAAAKALGVGTEAMRRRLATFTAFERTFAVREDNGITILDNTYNASYEGFEAAIRWATSQPHAPKILLFDGIIELGDDEERLHTMLAEQAATVFERVYAVHERFLRYFTPSFGHRASLARAPFQHLSPGTLLVCMGRMPTSLIAQYVHGASSHA